MIKTYKFKIRRPSKRIVQTFEQTLDICRELYNAGLQERRDAWRLEQKSISYYEQQNQIPELKLIREDLKLVYARVLLATLQRLDRTFNCFFSRIKKGLKAGYPRFKSANRFNSFTYTQHGFYLEGDKLKLSKIGTVRLHLSQNIQGKIKTCTIKRETSGWFVFFAVETIAEILPKTNKQVGIDLGIENFATLSDGTQIENFRFFERSQKKLRKAQRKLCRRKKFSNRWKKAVKQVAKTHEKIRNQRNDFQHKLSTKLVKEFDLIVVEDLNFTGLVKSILGKQVIDVAWSSFIEKLLYKAENAGKQVIKVNPKGTSQTCLCGEKVEKTLKQRQHKCLSCGYENHRDIVSAEVILKLGLGHSLQAQTKTVRL